MHLPDFHQQPLWVNGAVFALAALAVWVSGTRVARYADAIATQTGFGHITVGLILLGGVTSLPEMAVTVTAAMAGNTELAVNNLLGGIAMQKAILAGADALIGKEALTMAVTTPAVLLQAALSILLLVIVAAGIVIGDTLWLGTGLWCWAILALYGFSIWKIAKAAGRDSWIVGNAKQQLRHNRQQQQRYSQPQAKQPLRRLLLKTAATAAVILVAGFFLSRTGDAIAVQTGLGQHFVGAVLLAFATSLPEISTVVATLRLRQYEMAISDVLGTNLFNTSLLFLVDAAYTGQPVLDTVGDFSLLTALLGILMATIYLVGLIERRNRTIARMGIDSLAILVAYAGGLFLLYQLR